MDGDDATKQSFINKAGDTTTAGLGYVGHGGPSDNPGFLALPPHSVPPGQEPPAGGGLFADDPKLVELCGKNTSLEEVDLLACNTGLPHGGKNLWDHLIPNGREKGKVTALDTGTYAGMLKRISKELSKTLDPSKVDTNPKWWEWLIIKAAGG